MAKPSIQSRLRGPILGAFALAICVLVVPASASGPADVQAVPATAVVTASSGPYHIAYSFNDGPAALVVASPPLTVATAAGGALSFVPRGAGLAVEFPALCPVPLASTCPRAIMETAAYLDALNPGTGPISFGATVRLAPGQTSTGENLVQKGFSTTGGSQYKLQIDGYAGQPSCAVVGVASATIYLVKSPTSVADGQWHRISCVLAGGGLAIRVDGATRGWRAVPVTLRIANNDPLRIGGKGTSPNNDQFDGEIDNVWVTVG